MSALTELRPLSRPMPADRHHPRRHARRGGSDRRGDLRCRHPHHRGAAQLARPARRASNGWPTKFGDRGAGRRRHGSRRPPMSPGVQGGRRTADRFAQHQRRRHSRARRPRISFPAPAISRRPKPSPRWSRRDRAQAVPRRGREPGRAQGAAAVLPKDVPLFVVGGITPGQYAAVAAMPERPASGSARASTSRASRPPRPPKRRAPMSPGLQRDEADPDRDPRLRQDRRRSACAVDRRPIRVSSWSRPRAGRARASPRPSPTGAS